MANTSNNIHQTPSISPNFKQYLAGCRYKKYKQSEPIFYQGEVPRHGLIVKKGIVKAYDIGSSGDEKIVALCSAEEFIPPEWVFKKSPVSLYYYESFSESETYIVERDIINKLIVSDTNLSHWLFERYMGLYIGSVQQINALEQSKSASKILYIIQYLVMKFGKKINSEKQLISLRLTHQDIAGLTGLTRETTSVELNRLKKIGVISYKDQHYIVSSVKLQQLFGSDEFFNYKY
jgi:CRP-like cAMP-binding protein